MEVIAISKFRGEAEWIQRGVYHYTAWRHRGQTVSYRCGRSDCPVKFSMRAGIPGPIRGQHDHEPEPWIPERNEMFCRLKSRCTTEVTMLQTIFQEEAERYPLAAPHLMYEKVLPSMRKWRRSTQPAVPGTLPEYSRALAAHPVFGPMHVALVSAGGASAVIIAMPGFAECLRESVVVVADGTFLTVPAGLQAYQLLTLHTISMGQHYHPVVALMENRRQNLYRAVLGKVWELAGNPQPETVITDYEPALQGALREVVDAPLQGCYFHFLQALVKRARLDHVPMRLVRLYATLALLPAERAPAAFAALPDAAVYLEIPINEAYHVYFRDYWMDRIRPETFSVYEKAHRTSNTAESFHAYLKKMLGASPNIWRFTQVLQQKFAVCASRRQASLAGAYLPLRRGRPGVLVKQNVVAGNLDALARATITLREFLVMTSQAIVVGAGLAANDVPDVAEEVEVEMGPAVAEEPRPATPEHQGPPRCGVCRDNPPTRVLIPCGHTLCTDCLNGVEESVFGTRCPFCRHAFEYHIAVYL